MPGTAGVCVCVYIEQAVPAIDIDSTAQHVGRAVKFDPAGCHACEGNNSMAALH